MWIWPQWDESKLMLNLGRGAALSGLNDDDGHVDSVDPEPYLDLVMLRSCHPMLVARQNDLRLVVETPLLRDAPGSDQVKFTGSSSSCASGPKSEEVWFLVRPASEILPTD